MRTCSADGCPDPHYGKGYCRRHWERMHRNGTLRPKIAPRNMPTEERLERRSQREGDCIVWTGTTDRYGYGQIDYQGRPWTAHRLSYVTHVGPLSPGEVVRHTCDNPPCINPRHLLAGTHAENGNDKKVRGRSTFGERNAAHRLTEDDVLAIDAALRSGSSGPALALRYGVGKSTISRIRRCEAWGYLFPTESTFLTSGGKALPEQPKENWQP